MQLVLMVIREATLAAKAPHYFPENEALWGKIAS